MLKITFELDDLKGLFTSTDNGNWKLEAEDPMDETKGTKVLNTKQMAAILFCMHDERFESVDEIIQVAYDALKDFNVSILP